MSKGAPPKKYQHINRIDSPIFRPGAGPFNTLDEFRASFKYIGQYRAVNGVLVPRINVAWHFLEMHLQMTIPDKVRDSIQLIVQTFADETAVEKGAIPWAGDDKAIMECAQRIFKEALALQRAITDFGSAPQILIERLEKMEGGTLERSRFSMEEFRPRLSELVGRANILLQELEVERAKGVRLEIGSAWRQFVFCMADVYIELMAKEPKVTEISDSNRDTGKHSQFTKFAFTAALHVPAYLRDPKRENIDTFSTALRGPLRLWRQTRKLSEKKSSKSR